MDSKTDFDQSIKDSSQKSVDCTKFNNLSSTYYILYPISVKLNIKSSYTVASFHANTKTELGTYTDSILLCNPYFYGVRRK